MKKHVKHNFNSKTISDAVLDDMVRVVNFAASAVAGARIKGDGDQPPKTVGIRSVFTHDSFHGPAPRGGPPGILTGTLARSFTTKVARRVRGRAIAQAGTDVTYGRIHEFGLGRMPRRPFVRRGINKARPAIKKQLKRVGLRVKTAIAKKVEPPK